MDKRLARADEFQDPNVKFSKKQKHIIKIISISYHNCCKELWNKQFDICGFLLTKCIKENESSGQPNFSHEFMKIDA